MQPLVSIIVPVFNSEKYLHKCLSSIIKQSYYNIEVILIEDGSKDNSGSICEEYALSDMRVNVIHVKNGGVAKARQIGLDIAKGEYLIYVDSDDWVEPSMLEELVKEAKVSNSDVVICDFFVNENYYVNQRPSQFDHLVVLKELFQHLHGSCWNKLLRRECVLLYNISFSTELSYCEDLTFWVKLFKNPVRISYVPKAFYHYVNLTDSNSIVHSYMNRKTDEGWKVIRILWKELKDYPQIRRIACSRSSFSIVNDAFQYGCFNSFTFAIRYFKYIPFILSYSRLSFRERLGYVRICMGFYSYYKYR